MSGWKLFILKALSITLAGSFVLRNSQKLGLSLFILDATTQVAFIIKSSEVSFIPELPVSLVRIINNKRGNKDYLWQKCDVKNCTTIKNFSPKMRWLTTNTKVNSCFAIFLNSEIKELKKIILTYLLLQQLQYLQV